MGATNTSPGSGGSVGVGVHHDTGAADRDARTASGARDLVPVGGVGVAGRLEGPLLDRWNLPGDREQRLLVPQQVGLGGLPGVHPVEVDVDRREPRRGTRRT